ncbi:hypothetical protein [Pyrobaculum ferrireducens]|uniref:Uncharacterized protein n=1 Tax=Pyrobaculum ferrireducens TaxID=1104324 RepID=G7VAT7_9CREN|nr:hypothetical protein [Pyrobaculum ferrireducens]AET33515.1 hypothetical protein P186_2123 [Pyrobaculum ferrireducens]
MARPRILGGARLFYLFILATAGVVAVALHTATSAYALLATPTAQHYTAAIQATANRSEVYHGSTIAKRPAAENREGNWTEAASRTATVDICSGGAAPWPFYNDTAKKALCRANVTVVLVNVNYDVKYVNYSNTTSKPAEGGGYVPLGNYVPGLWWVLALWSAVSGMAGVALYIYAVYLSLACEGALCKWRRFKAILPFSAATVAASASLAPLSPLYAALAVPGVWGVWHYYRARRRLAVWLSTILT